MSMPRLGNCMIINNISSSMPGSEMDVTALKEAFQIVGFEVHVCRDCDEKVYFRGEVIDSNCCAVIRICFFVI